MSSSGETQDCCGQPIDATCEVRVETLVVLGLALVVVGLDVLSSHLEKRSNIIKPIYFQVSQQSSLMFIAQSSKNGAYCIHITLQH